MKLLVVGCGSIGERHIRNLKTFFKGEILACDTDPKRLSVVGKKYHIQTYTDLEQALDRTSAALVCTPPSSHIPIALVAAKHGAHVFVEKPMSHNLKGVNELIKKAKKENLVIFVGYNFRFHPGIKLVKKMLDEGRIGKALSARAEFGQYLPGWRPWQDYRQGYTARKELGGGIILDGSHEIDYIRWFLGEVEEVFCSAGKISNLEVETEDTAEIVLKFRSGVIAEIHLDFVRRDYSRNCALIGEKGSIVWNYPEKLVKAYSAQGRRWRTFDISGEPNDMYVHEMKHFIRCVQGKEEPLVSGEEGKRTLEIALAAKQSAKTGKIVRLEG